MKLGIASRVALFVSLIFACAIGAMALLVSRQSSMQLEELIGARLESIAATTALDLSGDAHQTIRSKEDLSRAEYRELRVALDLAAAANGVKPHLMYTLRPRGDAYELVVMADESRNDIGNAYQLAPPELGQVLATGRPGHRGRYVTENGTWISGFAPIRDASGQAVALVEVDYEISEFIGRYRAELARIMAIAAAVLIFGVLAVFWVIRATTARIVRLTELADAISRGQVEKEVAAMGTDEVGRLAAALERLRESVRTSLELLASER
jgi:methyl-accepting chemotaxis protein